MHVEMDAFYASVQMRDNPQWIDIPMAVGSNFMLVRVNAINSTTECVINQNIFLCKL